MSVRQIVSGVVDEFREELTTLVERSVSTTMTPVGFTELVDGLKSVLASAGRRAFVEAVKAHEEVADVVELSNKRYRFKQVSTKDWLTPFGLVRLDRRYFQPDEGGDGFAPLDQRSGMTGRYMTPDMEEATALASADLSPSATRCLLSKVLPQAPSDKAIRRVIADVGQWVDDGWDEVEYRVAEEAPLPEGDLLVVSVDGVNVPMREEGVRTGRPAERPGVRDSNQTTTSWREAGVGTISIYKPGDGTELPGDRPHLRREALAVEHDRGGPADSTRERPRSWTSST